VVDPSEDFSQLVSRDFKLTAQATPLNVLSVNVGKQKRCLNQAEMVTDVWQSVDITACLVPRVMFAYERSKGY
jgi:hypothetical protein